MEPSFRPLRVHISEQRWTSTPLRVTWTDRTCGGPPPGSAQLSAQTRSTSPGGVPLEKQQKKKSQSPAGRRGGGLKRDRPVLVDGGKLRAVPKLHVKAPGSRELRRPAATCPSAPRCAVAGVRCCSSPVLGTEGAAAAEVSAESREERPEELAPSAAGRPPRLWADGGFQFTYPRQRRWRGRGESRCCPGRGGQRRLLQPFRWSGTFALQKPDLVAVFSRGLRALTPQSSNWSHSADRSERKASILRAQFHKYNPVMPRRAHFCLCVECVCVWERVWVRQSSALRGHSDESDRLRLYRSYRSDQMKMYLQLRVWKWGGTRGAFVSNMRGGAEGSWDPQPRFTPVPRRRFMASVDLKAAGLVLKWNMTFAKNPEKYVHAWSAI